ncbi:YHS domain-containing protein [Desulfurivibrio dismutans]|uniref:YHS domain-containing protein n=1 Tax=Desulfurivibrio dismutans TaxID=1398908 RepID=UPI0023D9E40C|nr:YHS domain-containing protein [Desulfurivibrio alkaliphilus]MDF1613815.1 hypothetical protein [Desulfurivibrio alkaliphilus]
MHPLKIIIIIVLGYLLYRLYMAGRKKRLAAEDQRERAAINDVLVQDPSCGAYVPRGQALRHQHHGEEFFFCSEKCRRTFVEKKKDNSAG